MATEDQIVKQYQGSLLAAISRVQSAMAIYAAELETEEGRLVTTANNLQRAAQVAAQLNTELARSGYMGSTRELYGQVAGLIDELLTDAPDEVKPVADSLLRAFASNSVRQLDNAWFEITGTVRQVMEAAIVGQQPIGDLVAWLAGDGQREEIRLVAPLDAPFRTWVNWASAAVDTAISALVRQINTSQAVMAGVKYFRYSGSTIRTSRDFCRIMRNVVLTLEELASIESDPKLRALNEVRGRQPDVVSTLGGFRCRHRLVPISLKRAKDRGYPLFADDWPELVRKAQAA